MSPVEVRSEPATQFHVLDWESKPGPFGRRANTLTTEHTIQGGCSLFEASTLYFPLTWASEVALSPVTQGVAALWNAFLGIF